MTEQSGGEAARDPLAAQPLANEEIAALRVRLLQPAPFVHSPQSERENIVRRLLATLDATRLSGDEALRADYKAALDELAGLYAERDELRAALASGEASPDPVRVTVEARYATFEDEDHSWCVVTIPGGDYVAWSEMTQADADRLVAILNAPPLYTFEHDHFAKIVVDGEAPPDPAPRPSVTWKGADRTAIVLMAPIVDGLCSGCGTKPSRETGSCRCVFRVDAVIRGKESDPAPRPEDEARRLLGYLWNATGRSGDDPVRSLFDEDDPIVADVERLAIFDDRGSGS